jgi:hypothetical protein
MLEPAFANAGTTRVQLSDFTARRMFTSYFVERGRSNLKRVLHGDVPDDE